MIGRTGKRIVSTMLWGRPVVGPDHPYLDLLNLKGPVFVWTRLPTEDPEAPLYIS